MAGETVVILRGAGVEEDQHGDPIPGAPDETEVPGCVVWPRASAEDAYQRDTVTEGMVVQMPSGTDVRATDLVRVRGVVYQVDGEPGDFRNPFAASSLLVVNLTRSEG